MKQRLLHALIRLKPPVRCSRLPSFRGLRAFSDFPSAAEEPLKQWSFTVRPFIQIKCTLHCNISIRPLDPHAFPNADRAFICVHGPSGAAGPEVEKFVIQYDDKQKLLTVQGDHNITQLSVHLTTPIKSDLSVITQGSGSVKIQHMESDLCEVQTEKGSCILQSIKSHKVQVHSSGGNITGLGTIHGDVDISTAGDSSVDIKKVQGTSMRLSTEHGPLNVKAIYAETSVLESSSGKVHVGHVHGETRVQSDTGDIVIDSSSGALTALAHAGNIDAYVSQTGTADLHTKQGAVNVRVPSPLKAWVQLCGTTVDTSSENFQETERQTAEGKMVLTGQLNGGTQEECWIRATADRGSVTLETQSWFETLKLGS